MASELRFRGDGTHPNFPAWLRDRKQRGSSILVTGDVPDDVSARATRSLLGRKAGRRRVLALTDRTIRNVDSRLPDGTSVGDPATWVVDQRHGERSAPTAASGVTSHLELSEADDIHQLSEEIQTAISFYEDRTNGLRAAQLRVGVDSLYPFVEEDVSETKRALRNLNATVRGVHGMAHYHLRVDDDAPIVDELTSLFDARIELRRRPGLGPEQRWHVPELDETTVWVEL